MVAGLIPDLAVPLLVDQDWLGFPTAMAAMGWRRRRKHSTRQSQQPHHALPATSGTVLLAEQESVNAKANSEPSIPANPLSNLSHQALGEGNFGRQQKEADQLKHCWGQILLFDDESQRSNLPLTYFLVKNGLLYYQCK